MNLLITKNFAKDKSVIIWKDAEISIGPKKLEFKNNITKVLISFEFIFKFLFIYS